MSPTPRPANASVNGLPAPPAPMLLVRGGFVFDGEASIRRRADVLVEDGRIVAVDTPIEREGAAVVDATGCTVMPGLIDCHVHLTQAHEDQIFDDEHDPPPPRALRRREGERWAAAMLRSGFTAVRDLGSEERLNIELAASIERGVVTGPDVIACGWRLGPYAPGAVNGPPPEPTTIFDWLSRAVQGVDAVRQAVHDEIDAGAGVVKLYGHSRRFDANGEPLDQFTQEELIAAVEAAHARGRRSAIHTFIDSVAWRSLVAQIDSIEHGTALSDRSLWRMAEQGVYHCPTILALEHWRTHPQAIPERFYSPQLVARIERIQGELMATVERSYRAGVQIVAGSDQRGTRFPLGENGAEIGCLAAAGLTAADALHAATSRAALLLGRGDHSGRIRPGYDADLAVVAGNPLTDLSLLRGAAAIRAVIKRGEVVRT